jgi:hypothetical protein
MNRFVTIEDLTRLLEAASTLGMLAEGARTLSNDLNVAKRDTNDVHEAIKQCNKRLGKKDLPKRQRGKIKRKLEFYDEWLYHAGVEIEKKNAAFSGAMTKIESELRELAQVYAALANVHRFEHRLNDDPPRGRPRQQLVGV